MISVIVYGRNDAHGYNLHRRAALSLNCIAEVLTDPDDEIVFVDYNTPDELPTFVEALADTLTDRCLGLLRVLRVPAAIHEQRFAARTHLPAIEPVARNTGVRRANPSNRWLLSTNTDMIFLSHSDRSLSEMCGELPDGFYGLPRFELPEWLWERLPRSDPSRAMAEIERLGPGLRLDEPTVSHEWIRFDAPGDFQLILREDFLAIDGLDEDMLLGYHVDSNLSRRMLFHRGSIESLGDLAGYHCNHNREPTVYHGTGKVANDLQRFVDAIDRAELPAQRETWGLAGEALEEVPLRERAGPRLADSLVAAIPNTAGPRTESDAARVPYELTYDSGHVLTHVADSLAVSPSTATIGYAGVNPVLQRMLETVVARLGFENPLAVAELDDLSSVEELDRHADVLIVDFGVDASDPAASRPADEHQPAPLPPRLVDALDALDRLVELERARLKRGEQPRRFVLVHSWTVFWDAYVLANLDCSHTTAHSRVRRATVRSDPAYDEETRAALARERRLRRWASRGDLRQRRLRVQPGEAVEPAHQRDYGGFGDGWAFPEEAGIWTQGERSSLALALDGGGESEYVLALSLGSICVGPDESLRVAALVNGERAAAREFRYGDPDWHVEFPARGGADGSVEVTLEIEEPRTPLDLGWSIDDDRRLGILLRSITVLPANDDAAQAGLARERRVLAWAARGEVDGGSLHVQPGERVDLAALHDYGGFGNGWMLYPDQAGVWTEGSRSELAVALDRIRESDYALVLSLGSICVPPDGSLKVDVLANGERAAARELRYGDPEWRIESPASAPADGQVEVKFAIEEPRSPRELGWSTDDRRLGILLRAITVEEVDRSVRPGEKVVFAEGSGAERLLGGGWSTLEPTGVWTDGEKASLVLKLTPTPPGDAELVLDVEPFVTPAHPELRVEVSARGQQLGTRVFRHRRGPFRRKLVRPLRAVLPASVRDTTGRAALELRVHDPASPRDLGLSDDSRRLGLYLRSLTVRTRR